MQEEDRINYSKQIKSAQQGWKEMEGGRGRLGRFPVDTTAKYLRRAVGLGGGRFTCPQASQRPPWETTANTLTRVWW